jgi:23S rRNA (cytidine1920-2'-O)/16S rRNA (cytidine1409-2'-O)-methyltransferase
MSLIGSTGVCTTPWPISTSDDVRRLDAELVRRGLARSRDEASTLIKSGRVLLGGVVASKPATQVGPDASLLVESDEQVPRFVSRGGHKLDGALEVFCAEGLVIAGRHALDVGASTGGFTDVLLQRGAVHVVALDVGYGQLAWALREDERVRVIERTNIRDIEDGSLVPAPDLVVADVSFISLTKVIGPVLRVATENADLVLMVKPQFELGRRRVPSGGVVRDPADRADAVRMVVDSAWEKGLGVVGVTASPLPGPAGNVEYFVWLRASADSLSEDDLMRAVQQGPQ